MKIVPVSDIPFAQDVPTDNPLEVYKLAREMEFVCEQEGGVGLSAVQVGIPWKLFIAKIKGHYEHWINATYEPVEEGKSSSIEGCLSLRNAEGDFRRFQLMRYKHVKIQGKKLVLHPVLLAEEASLELTGFDAIVFQHEIEHQQGILISDIGKELELF